MTVQYEQPNINQMGTDATLVVDADATLTADDSLVLVDTTNVGSTITLAPAASMPGRIVTIVAQTGLTNNVGLAVSAGDSIQGTNTDPIVTDWGNITLVSDGGTNWIAISDNP